MNKYKQQAKDFLNNTKTSIKIKKAIPQKHPLWYKKGEEHGINYSVTLSNDRHTYTFDFWNNIAAKHENKAPDMYSVLACLSPLHGNTFEEFCESYEYDTDSIRDLKIYEAVKEEDRNLRKLWSPKELARLEEIN